MKSMILPGQDLVRTPIVEALRGAPPKFCTHNPGLMGNCQRCVAAYEARRRGCEASAKPRIFREADSLPFMNGKKGWPAIYQNYKLESCAAPTPELARGKVEALMKLYGNGSRAVVKLNWRLTPNGHVFIAENQEETVCFLDLQTRTPSA